MLERIEKQITIMNLDNSRRPTRNSISEVNRLALLPNPENDALPIVTIDCVVVGIKKTKSIIFLQVTDGKAETQLALSRNEALSANSIPQNIERLSRVRVRGRPELFKGTWEERPGLRVHSMEVTVPGEVAFDTEDHSRLIFPSIELSRTRRVLSSGIFESNEFIEIEATYITNSNVDPELDPVQVMFSGRGSPLHIEPTPLPQLMYAALTGGYTRLFCSSRLFSRAFRDGYTSAESPILSGLALFGPRNVNQMNGVVAAWIDDVVREIEQLLEKNSSGEGGQMGRILTFDLDFNSEEFPSFEKWALIKRVVPKGQSLAYFYDATETFELHYSPAIDLRSPILQTAVVEGQIGTVGADLRYVWLVVHLERIARALAGNYERWFIERRRVVPRASR